MRTASDIVEVGSKRSGKTAQEAVKRAPVAIAATTVEPGRRRPTQARSQRRLEAIVEAAAEAFAAHGFGEATMEGIAARAGTSIGSLYQFFPNKTAVFREVAGRCMQEARRGFAELLGPAPLQQPWQAVLGRIIDGFRRLHRESVVMQAVWRNLELYGEYAEEDQALMREIVQVTAALLAGWVPALPEERRRVVATMLVNTVATTMLVIVREDDEAREDAIVAETKLMLARYLSVYLGEG
jgi:AcrR family transcriptional regulator